MITVKRLQELLTQCAPDALRYAFDRRSHPEGIAGSRSDSRWWYSVYPGATEC